jgi:hypothetical protein
MKNKLNTDVSGIQKGNKSQRNLPLQRIFDQYQSAIEQEN